MPESIAYIFSKDEKVAALLLREGYPSDQPSRIPVPRSMLTIVEDLLHGMPYTVGFANDPNIKRDESAKYDAGWGPDPFHTVGD